MVAYQDRKNLDLSIEMVVFSKFQLVGPTILLVLLILVMHMSLPMLLPPCSLPLLLLTFFRHLYEKSSLEVCKLIREGPNIRV